MRMSDLAQIIIASSFAVVASSGFWAFVMQKMNKKDAQTDLLIGLAHDRIMDLGMKYMERGYITSSEYENLHTYLYGPYQELNADDESAKRIMQGVSALPIRC